MINTSTISLSKGAKELDISLSEFIDLLNYFGIPANIDQEDYPKGLKNIEKVW